MTWKGCAHAQPEVAQYPPSGAFSPEVRSSPRGLPLEVGRCSLRRLRPISSMAIGTSPGYPPLLFSYNISIMVFTYSVFGYVLQVVYHVLTVGVLNNGTFNHPIEGHSAHIQACDWLYI